MGGLRHCRRGAGKGPRAAQSNAAESIAMRHARSISRREHARPAAFSLQRHNQTEPYRANDTRSDFEVGLYFFAKRVRLFAFVVNLSKHGFACPVEHGYNDL